MRKFIVTIISLILISIAGVQSPAQTSKSSPEDSLRAADQQWLRVFAAKDVEKSVAGCTEDASVLAPNAPIETGKEAIGKLFSAFFAIPELKISWQPVRVQIAKSGELGYTSGAYQMSFSDPSGKTVSDVGKYVTVWKKQSDGSWKVLLDIFNSDLPLPSPTSKLEGSPTSRAHFQLWTS